MVVQLAPYEIFRIEKHEGSATVSLEEVDNLNRQVIEHDKQTSNEEGKVNISKQNLSLDSW